MFSPRFRSLRTIGGVALCLFALPAAGRAQDVHVDKEGVTYFETLLGMYRPKLQELLGAERARQLGLGKNADIDPQLMDKVGALQKEIDEHFVTLLQHAAKVSPPTAVALFGQWARFSALSVPEFPVMSPPLPR